jgi:manganese/zinc/iron transport system permease protein
MMQWTRDDGQRRRRGTRTLVALAALVVMAVAGPVVAADGIGLAEIGRVLVLRDYNTRLVVLSTTILGLASGLVGTFLLLRRRALLADALSHAMLPGIAIAFMVMVAAGASGKWLPGLLLGATATGLVGVGGVIAITRWSRLKDDAALGIVLSVLFGLGVVLMGFVQSLPETSAAGLGSFIYGKTASIVRADLALIAIAGASIALACALLYKEFTILCFDEGFAAAQGWPTLLVDALLMALVTAVTVIGLQAVGLILVVSLLIIPAAAARFWTERLGRMTVIAAAIGATSGWLGASLSALLPGLPAGAIIVVVAAVVFVASMFLGPARGILVRATGAWRLGRRIGRQHLLRAMYERIEAQPSKAMSEAHVATPELLAMRSWTRAGLDRLLARARREGLLEPRGDDQWGLTPRGLDHARRIVRNHRLWETFLITHAEVAPSHVDRDADQIEHVLGPGVVSQLEQILHEKGVGVPGSPHAIPRR